MNWKEEALAHAKDQDPKESCGLLLNIRGKEKYFPCQNFLYSNIFNEYHCVSSKIKCNFTLIIGVAIFKLISYVKAT